MVSLFRGVRLVALVSESSWGVSLSLLGASLCRKCPRPPAVCDRVRQQGRPGLEFPSREDSQLEIQFWRLTMGCFLFL